MPKSQITVSMGIFTLLKKKKKSDQVSFIEVFLFCLVLEIFLRVSDERPCHSKVFSAYSLSEISTCWLTEGAVADHKTGTLNVAF